MMHTPIQSVIQIDLLAGASLDMPRDEQFEFIDYLLAAHCGFAEFCLPDDRAPWAIELGGDDSAPRAIEVLDGSETYAL